MTSIEEHKKRAREHLKEINDAIDEGIETKPVTIGFHTSQCAMELLEVYLHKKNLISTGKTIKHTWFERPKKGQKIPPLIERKLPVHFEGKKEIFELIYNLQEVRDTLIYGKGTTAQIKQAIENFNRLKQILKDRLLEEGEEIE